MILENLHKDLTVTPLLSTNNNNWYYSHILLSAGSDYGSVAAAQLRYSSSSGTTQSFDVTILQDDLTELREYFFAIITDFAIIGQPLLSEQESGRIIIVIDEAQVFINDTDSKKTYRSTTQFT